MKQYGYLAFSLLLVLALASHGAAQSEAENAAYRTFYNENDAQKKIDLGERLLIEFEDSAYRSPTLQTILGLYMRAQQFSKVLEHADKLPAELPGADEKLKVTVYTYAIAAAQAANNPTKIIEYGDMVLKVDPNNLQAQIFVASTIPVAMPQDRMANDRALELANKALGGVAQYFTQGKPATTTDAQWTQARMEYEDQIHSALGLIYFNRTDYLKSAEKYELILKNDPKDAVARLYLGLAYRNQAADSSKALLEAIKAYDAARTARASQPAIDELDATRQFIQDDFQQKRDRALDELAAAVAVGGPASPQAQDALEKLYATKNNGSLQGLDQLIAKKKNELQE